MSSHDGSRGEDGFYNNSVPAGGDMALPLAHQLSPLQSQAAASGAIPPQIMWQPPPLLNQQYIHHQAHAQVQPPPQQQQQQQQYNELFYNMHAQAFATPTVQPETYSVLPVGHGNFLKVYHRAEGGPAVSGTNDAILYQQQFQQQQQHQHQQQFHMPTPQQTQPMFNSYELFSSNTLMPTPENSNIANATPSVAAPDLSMPPPQLHLLGNNAEMHSTVASTSTTNMIINKLVNNWSPNLTGGTYAQFSSSLGQVPTPALHNNAQSCAPLEAQQIPTQMPSMQPPLPTAVNTNLIVQEAAKPVFKSMSQTAAHPVNVQPAYLPQATQPTQAACASIQQPQQPQKNLVDASLLSEVRPSKEPTAIVVPTGHVTATALLQSAEGSKKRIVAEVKPMRMTYSDVLSKFNNQHDNQTVLPVATVKSNSNRSAKQTASSASTAQSMNERKTEQKRVVESNTNSSLTQRQSSVEEPGSPQAKPLKKSPTHDNKENIVHGSVTNAKSTLNNKQRLASSTTNHPTNPKNSQKPIQKSGMHDICGGVGNKKRTKKSVDVDYNTDGTTTHLTNKNTSSANGTDKDFNGFYNVTAKNTDNGGIKSSQNTSSSINNFRRSAKSSTYGTASAASTQNYSRNAARSSNGSASSSYGYSTRRGRGGNAGASNGNSNRNYELAKKFLHAWFEYTIKILTWLFYLVYDIVVLGFSMVYERLSHFYACGFSYVQQLHKDFKQNSNRPNIALKNYLRRFDARFKKNSRWAFWRRFYKKKTAEASSDFYKNGRLPQTGEEAMYSLLNCKGKDAYSILGVPSDSSQEQIRKHYKKIAVLVHPDKNKQAGAEEAFKVLQRAFELIGEPENRVAYDRSLDEALHAEKAWTELHDLLSQLQTKITEAANTIRCSTCGLRHPRKLTDRPHYAARECASCKIRHSAREGDIWAETTLLGLRWKYLALMEGKVYDITEWANCQKGALSHLEPNSHMVQYRIVRGAQQHQQQQQQMHQQHQQQAHAGSSHQQFHHSHPQGSNKYKRDVPPSEASLHEFLDNLYSGQHPGGQPNSTAFSGSTRKRTRRN